MASCPICKGTRRTTEFAVTREDKYLPLAGPNASPARYWECASCEAMIFEGDGTSEHVYDVGTYYAIDGDPMDFLKERFDQINSLPEERSDNVLRVRRIRDYLNQSGFLKKQNERLEVADVGAGMGVFLHRFLDENWNGTALEPDPYACTFLRNVLPGVAVFEGYSHSVQHTTNYDLITLNRVLEHVTDPRSLLEGEASRLNPGGLIYIEVPDTLSYYLDGANNEAFGHTHFIIYSPLTLATLLRNSTLEVVSLNRVQEPSTKYTLYAFLKKRVVPGI